MAVDIKIYPGESWMECAGIGEWWNRLGCQCHDCGKKNSAVATQWGDMDSVGCFRCYACHSNKYVDKKSWAEWWKKQRNIPRSVQIQIKEIEDGYIEA